GLDRGLKDAIRAAALLNGPVQLHVRGSVSSSVREELTSLARECGIASRFYIHDQVAPTELLSRTVEHDVGLALEQGDTHNRAICAANKLFFYLLGGIAVAATDVIGQRVVLEQLPEASFLYKPGDIATLARDLEKWRTDSAALQ